MNERSAWILAIGTVAASVGTSAVVVSALVPAPREEVGEARLDQAALRELTVELERLRSAIQRLEDGSGLAPAGTVAGTRLPADGPPPPTGTELERLVSAVERLETALSDENAVLRDTLTSLENGGAASPSRPTEIDWPAWRELYGVHQGDPKAAAARVRLLTTDQLLERYGPPTTMRSRDDGSRTWYYYDDSPGGEPLSVTLRILDGYVTELWMEP